MENENITVQMHSNKLPITEIKSLFFSMGKSVHYGKVNSVFVKLIVDEASSSFCPDANGYPPLWLQYKKACF
jgi:hypothetical protein